jgi:[acyl-carrier-protein] S-malonyltransferase
MAIGKDHGVRRAVPLPVSAPFHCALMQPAADRMAQALSEVALNPPAVPVVANVTAQPVSSVDDIRRLLVEQVTGTVRWRESISFMADQGVELVYEIGAGKVLTGMVRRIDERLSGKAIGAPGDVESASGQPGTAS